MAFDERKMFVKTFKVMGLTAGRKNGNSEILLKEALTVCESQGAEVLMVNLHDYHFLHCTGCEACTQGMARGVRVDCILKDKDDKDLVTNKMLEMDAVIFSIPTYDLMPCSAYLTYAHRNLAYETSFLQKIGAIEKKPRIAGIISVGGSTRSWQGMALEGMAGTMFTNSFKIVDMMLATRVSRPGFVLLKQELLDRAHAMGQNIMKSLNTDPAERTWLGDEDFGWCPNCHSNLLMKGEVRWDGLQHEVECVVCSAGGTLVPKEDGTYAFQIAEDGLDRDRFGEAGTEEHLEEIGTGMRFFYQPENQEIVKARAGSYKAKTFPTITK